MLTKTQNYHSAYNIFYSPLFLCSNARSTSFHAHTNMALPLVGGHYIFVSSYRNTTSSSISILITGFPLVHHHHLQEQHYLQRTKYAGRGCNCWQTRAPLAKSQSLIYVQVQADKIPFFLSLAQQQKVQQKEQRSLLFMKPMMYNKIEISDNVKHTGYAEYIASCTSCIPWLVHAVSCYTHNIRLCLHL